MSDGLEALKIMLRSWSGENIMVYSISQDTLAMTGASSYTIGSGGDADTTWPIEIKGAVVDTDYDLRIIGEAAYRSISRNTDSIPRYLYYNPAYPLGVLYPHGVGGNSMVIDSLKALTDPATLTTAVAFPTAYDGAIKWNLCLELAPEYGKNPNQLIIKNAHESKKAIQSKNMANQINEVDLSDVGMGGMRYQGVSYDINWDGYR